MDKEIIPITGQSPKLLEAKKCNCDGQPLIFFSSSEYGVENKPKRGYLVEVCLDDLTIDHVECSECGECYELSESVSFFPAG